MRFISLIMLYPMYIYKRMFNDYRAKSHSHAGEFCFCQGFVSVELAICISMGYSNNQYSSSLASFVNSEFCFYI